MINAVKIEDVLSNEPLFLFVACLSFAFGRNATRKSRATSAFYLFIFCFVFSGTDVITRGTVEPCFIVLHTNKKKERRSNPHGSAATR